jgi:hypothetical protein
MITFIAKTGINISTHRLGGHQGLRYLRPFIFDCQGYILNLFVRVCMWCFMGLQKMQIFSYE